MAAVTQKTYSVRANGAPRFRPRPSGTAVNLTQISPAFFAALLFVRAASEVHPPLRIIRIRAVWLMFLCLAPGGAR
jgi:hypothetical protein